MLLYMNIEEVSNPDVVLKRAKRLYGNDVQIYFSTRKDKKYMLIHPITGKKVHFGSMLYQDYTKHRDDQRRQRFQTRNKKWKDADLYSPAHASYHLLW